MASGHGVNFVESMTSPEAETLVSGLIVALILCLLGIFGAKRLRTTVNPIIPDKKLTLRNICELLPLFVLKLGDTVMGEANRKYLPILCTVFIYILFLNLFGLIPGFSMPTDSFQFNFGIGLAIFVCYNVWGIKEVGIKSYLKHLWGPDFGLFKKISLIGILAFVFETSIHILLFGIELISHAVRPLTLGLRLFGNMTGDHAVLSIFTELTKVGVPVIFYLMGTFVCFMQAFIFTMLSMVYIRLAVAHEESH
jgi:F-type H+-transporting ATPase subunit a